MLKHLQGPKPKLEVDEGLVIMICTLITYIQCILHQDNSKLFLLSINITSLTTLIHQKIVNYLKLHYLPVILLWDTSKSNISSSSLHCLFMKLANIKNY
jgi:hypothetical protein